MDRKLKPLLRKGSTLSPGAQSGGGQREDTVWLSPWPAPGHTGHISSGRKLATRLFSGIWNHTPICPSPHLSPSLPPSFLPLPIFLFPSEVPSPRETFSIRNSKGLWQAKQKVLIGSVAHLPWLAACLHWLPPRSPTFSSWNLWRRGSFLPVWWMKARGENPGIK